MDIAELSRPNTKSGRLQRECLALVEEHRADGAIPTSIRFIFYELEGRGIIPKSYPGKRQPSQDISDAMTVLREAGLVGWHEIADETRTLNQWAYSSSVYQYVVDRLHAARIDLWDGGAPPIILCESRSLAGVLRNTAGKFLAPIAATNGQAGGFLRTDIGPWVQRASEEGYFSTSAARVLYLGDLDLSGGQIEANTRNVLEDFGPVEWQRIAITEEQVLERNLTRMEKLDKRYKPARPYQAVETEALRQTEIQRILSETLEELVPSSLKDIRAIQREQSAAVRSAMEELSVNGAANGPSRITPPNPYGIPDVVVRDVVQKAKDTATEHIQSVAESLGRYVPSHQMGEVEKSLLRLVVRDLQEHVEED